MAEAFHGLEPGHAGSETRWPNALRGVWCGISGASGLVASLLMALATVTILTQEPRLFTPPELVPPDESLVAAYVPAAVALAIALVLVARLRRIPASVQIDAGGLSIFSSRGDVGQRVNWSALTSIASGSRWEGRELRAATGRRWFVSLELAEAIERRWHPTVPSATDR